jgi:hypothetical protein
MLCPDLPQGESFKLRGDLMSWVSSNFAFQIRRCIDGAHPGVVCKSKTEIDEYIKDIEINIWNR